MARRVGMIQKDGHKAKTRVAPLAKTRSRRSGPPIDKSQLGLPEPARMRSKSYLQLVAAQPSHLSGQGPCDPHHLKCMPKGRVKSSDDLCLPLTRAEHDEVEQHTRWEDELAWWRSKGIADPIGDARALKHELLVIRGRA